MPCSKYKGKQRALCFATTEWSDFSKMKGGNNKKMKDKYKDNEIPNPEGLDNILGKVKREVVDDKELKGPKGYWGI